MTGNNGAQPLRDGPDLQVSIVQASYLWTRSKLPE